MAGVCDSFQRGISYLRISVTDRCNLRCIYCMPPEGVPLMRHDDILRFEEMAQVVKACVELGIDKIRITGGEPLVRAGLVNLVRMIAGISGIREISMTTNGILLAEYAGQLKEAGLHRINVSLDTLNPDRFRQITRVGDINRTLKGIDEAVRSGLDPVKVNMVPMKGINEDEIADFARMTVDRGWNVRFIELMPLNDTARFIPSETVRAMIEKLGLLEPYKEIAGNGAARYYRLPHAKGTIGFISPVSEPFCQSCNRLRFSSTGVLYPCLFSKEGTDIRTSLREGAGLDRIKELVLQTIKSKPEQHEFSCGMIEDRRMSSIGG